jgi:ketosteroid isomerase-like protein
MRLQSIPLLCAFGLAMLAAAAVVPRVSNAELKQQVIDAERAFAATMQVRDHVAFTRFIAEEAVFFSGPTALRGRGAIAKAWLPYYDKPAAPFSWEPEQVEVVASGTLAYSGGPVHDPAGKVIGRYNAIWRLEAPGEWRVVFDRAPTSATAKSSPRTTKPQNRGQTTVS